MATIKKLKVIINCLDVIGDSMAGPAIRSWEFATQLSKKYSVVVLSPNKTTLKSKDFVLKQFSQKVFEKEIAEADFLITQKIHPKTAKLANKYKTKIIIDAYDPISIEALEALSHENMRLRTSMNDIILMEQSISLKYATSIICASEKQRDFWLGALSSLNKISPSTYNQDNSLRHIIDVVPFGLSSKEPSASKDGLLRKKFGLNKNDFVILWGGGIWNWFDPLSVIKAVNLVKETVPVKLVFMGIDHPNPDIPRMPMVKKAIELAKELDLYDKNVFFNEGWVPYDQRQEFLLGADAGISTHYDHLETRFSFRTRMLDYIWANLPIIATKGDSFAELIEEKDLGVVVDYDNEGSIAEAIKELYSNRTHYNLIKRNLLGVKEQFYWENCTLPIEHMISFWSENTSEKSSNVQYTTITLLNLYGGHKTIAKKYIKKIIGLQENKVRIGRVYRSQNIIRRKTFKKLLGVKERNSQ